MGQINISDSDMDYIFDKTDQKFKDSRTKLPGRNDFYKDTGKLFKKSGVESITLLTIEIDELEFFLRMFGPVIRDDLIHEVSERIRSSVSEIKTLYHITQFRFAVVLENINQRKAKTLTKKLLKVLHEPFIVNGVSLNIPSVVGISHYPHHADNLYELVRTVAFATHLARTKESKYAYYDRTQDEWEKYQFRLLKDIEFALDEESEINLAFQPIVSLTDNTCAKLEGLCRWTHKDLGNVSPAHFMPFIESSPLILPFTETTLGLSLDFYRALKTQGINSNISVNLSTALFQNTNLVEKLKEQFQFYNVSPENITLEITETGVMKDPRTAIFTLNRLREIGCQIAIDDFGTGHSSLAYLADLPIDIIKIDQCFIRDISKDRNKAIVGAAAKIAESLGLVTVAEGIESEEEASVCRELGIQFGQGYYFCKPSFPDNAIDWLRNRAHGTN